MKRRAQHRTIPRSRLRFLPPVCSANAAARLLGVPQPTLLDWIRRQKAPAQRLDTQWAVEKDEFEKWLIDHHRLKH